MKKPFPPETERFREPMTGTPYESRTGDQFGAFYVKAPGGVRLKVIVGDGEDWQAIGLPGEPWEHVSVSAAVRCPTWEEMCFVKRLFFRSDECVVQFHPPESEYVNLHEYCLHLWHCPTIRFPMPPHECVG